MSEENAVLMYKGRPLMRKDNLVYYGSMADSHIVMLQILETKKVGDMDLATRVCKEKRKRRLLHRPGRRLCMAGTRSGRQIIWSVHRKSGCCPQTAAA